MRRLIVVSGAGISVESGIRAFRTDTASGKAMWDEFSIDDVCNLESFNAGFRIKTEGFGPHYGFAGGDVNEANCYDLTHEFYNRRREELGTVEPNLAHLRVAEWYKAFPGRVINFTTNVDDLLERAGIPRSEVIHAHGYLREVRYKPNNAGCSERLVDVGFEKFNHEDYFWAKPNVTFFCETAPWYMGQINLFDTLTANDMVIVVGCSNQVINFNWELFPAVRRGTKMVVVNPAVPYHEMEVYQDNGVLVYRAGAVETFGNKHFINMVEKFLEG